MITNLIFFSQWLGPRPLRPPLATPVVPVDNFRGNSKVQSLFILRQLFVLCNSSTSAYLIPLIASTVAVTRSETSVQHLRSAVHFSHFHGKCPLPTHTPPNRPCTQPVTRINVMFRSNDKNAQQQQTCGSKSTLRLIRNFAVNMLRQNSIV